MKVTNCKILKPLRINAIVLYPFVFYCDAKPSEEIITHEMVHLQQIKNDGVVKFYSKYLWEYFLGRKQGLTHDQAYRNISYEKEAFNSTN
jgi:hypothetical protein